MLSSSPKQLRVVNGGSNSTSQQQNTSAATLKKSTSSKSTKDKARHSKGSNNNSKNMRNIVDGDNEVEVTEHVEPTFDVFEDALSEEKLYK